MLRDDDLHGALLRQLVFSLARAGWSRSRSASRWRWRCRPAAGSASLVLVLVALSLLIPWNVVGTIWQIFARADIGLLGARADASSASTTTTPATPRDAWLTVLLMDVWHWTPLVALLCYAGCARSPTPTTRRRASTAPRRWAVFRYIQLPKLRGVLMIAVLLRFMDSFMIYTEPFVLTGGGPGNATTFLSAST